MFVVKGMCSCVYCVIAESVFMLLGNNMQFVRPDLVDYVFKQINFDKLPAESRLHAGAILSISCVYENRLYQLGSGTVPDRPARPEDDAASVDAVISKFKEHMFELAGKIMTRDYVDEFVSSLYGSLEVTEVSG